MIDYIITIILTINFSLASMAAIQWLIKQSDDASTVQASLRFLFFSRLLFVVCVVASSICALVSTHLFISYLVMMPRELKYTVLLGLASIGITKYACQIFQLKSLIKRTAYRRNINQISLIFTSSTTACSFSLFAKSYIVLPVALLEDHAGFMLTLRHEMQHCRHRDGLWRHIMAMVGVICWWNPLFHQIIRYARHISELCCDQAVLTKYTLTAHEYITTLLMAKKQMDSACAAHIGLITNQLERQDTTNRILQLFKQPIGRITRVHAWLRIAIITFFVLISSLLTINATAHALLSSYQFIHMTHHILYT